MSFLTTAPALLGAAAAEVADIGSSLGEACAAAGAPTTGVIAAAEDEVSAAIASVFSDHAEQFEALSARAAAFHAQFSQALTSGAGMYAAAEAANALVVAHDPLTALVGAAQPFGVFSPVELLTGRPFVR